MADGKHTPGPWNAAAVLGFGEYEILAGGKDIAAVNASDGMDDPTAFPAEANGRLIVAAPETAAERDRLKEINAELLATLESINRCTSPGSRTVDELMRDMGLACDIARAAIARATGAA